MVEVASNFNQAMVRSHLFQTNADPQFQIAVIEEVMNNIHRAISSSCRRWRALSWKCTRGWSAATG